MIKIFEKRKIWYGISLAIMLIGLGFAIAFKGLNFGIDFKGGTILTFNMGEQVNQDKVQEVEKVISDFTKKYSARETNNTEIELIIQTGAIETEQVKELKTKVKEEFNLGDDYLVQEENISGSIGSELTRKAFIASILACIAIAIYIAVRFEFEFGIAAIVALIHDLLITLSVYAILRIRINSPFIAAVMTILGYSMNDTIVIFDRIRENKKKLGKVETGELINSSISQTMRRSIYTSLSTLLTIMMMVILVPGIRELTVPLIIGIITGTYSSIFIASPIWATLRDKKDKKNPKAQYGKKKKTSEA